VAGAQTRDWGAFQHLRGNRGGKHRRGKGKNEKNPPHPPKLEGLSRCPKEKQVDPAG